MNSITKGRDVVLIHRAMCEAEYLRTLAGKSPSFVTRFKWFTTNLDFLKQRVQDGKFNNSRYKVDAYLHIVTFEVEDLSQADWVRGNEIQYDRRRNPKITLIK